MSDKKLIIAACNRLSRSAEGPSFKALLSVLPLWPDMVCSLLGGLAMRDRLVPHLCSSGSALSGPTPSAAASVYSSTFPLPGTPWWVGTQMCILSTIVHRAQ